MKTNHAGYSYCGACGAHAYRQMDPSKIKRVFILGPSHHVRLGGCALTSTEKYKTPLYDLIIDTKINEELYGTGKFETMSITTDEDEHSIEMQLPYIAKAMESKKGNFTVVPVLVGSLNQDKESMYGKIFAKYLADPDNFFGMDKIERLDSGGFSDYLKQYQNTICGRHPIGVFLHTIDALRAVGNGFRVSFKFLKYSQSSKCSNTRRRLESVTR
ncbi:MEMO1-like protein [Mya arenaria]|uniref:MEMO1-like protein n=1 Tax=Mya arenaria TaxID=6604 RepID=A0ABY7FDC1_MYAAR|nr:MEMO1-like protein [Mya arenaria]